MKEAEFPTSLFDGKVLVGKEGWLFLDQDSNSVLRQFTGDLRLSDDQLREWRYLLENRIAWLDRIGASFAFLIAPNAHVIHADKLPSAYGAGERRPVLQLVTYLETSGSYARATYPIDELIDDRSRGTYSKTESHWSELGAFVAYRRLIHDIPQRHVVRVLTEDDVRLREHSWQGDLGAKLVPPQESPCVLVDVLDPKSELTFDNRVFNRGRRIEYSSSMFGASSTCLVFGDSFAIRMLPFLAESFQRLVFAHIPTLDYELVERERPDVVIYVLNERFIISVPTDAGAPTLNELAAQKEAKGELYPPRTRSGNRVDSPMPKPK